MRAISSTRMVLAMAATAVVVTTLPAAGGEKVIGKASTVRSGGGTFSLAANAAPAGSSGLRGSLQYERRESDGSALLVSAKAVCLWVSDDGREAEIAGPATVRENSVGNPVDDWFVVAIQDNGSTEPDRVRAGFVGSDYACSGAFVGGCATSGCPGTVVDGNFSILPAG